MGKWIISYIRDLDMEDGGQAKYIFIGLSNGEFNIPMQSDEITCLVSVIQRVKASLLTKILGL